MMTSVAEPARLVVRIGVHAGDILSVDVFGNGVNIAACLGTLRAPGAVCMSEMVQQQLHKQMHLTIDRGEHLVKNTSHPIRVHEIDSDTIRSIAPISSQQLSVDQIRGKVRGRRAPILAFAALLVAAVCGGVADVLRPTPGTMQLLGGKHSSIAVLPFTTSNDDGKADPFADALVDDLTTDLSISFPACSVIASASTFAFRAKDVGLRRMSQELGAKCLLTGSVKKTAEHLRVNVHPVDGDSGEQL